MSKQTIERLLASALIIIYLFRGQEIEALIILLILQVMDIYHLIRDGFMTEEINHFKKRG